MVGKKLYIPNTFIDINSILSNSGLKDIEEIEVAKDNPFFDSRDNCNAIINRKNNTLLVGCKKTVIPESVSTIGSKAFYNSGIKNIYIPKQISYIALDAFNGMDKYDSIKVEKDNPFFEVEDNRTIIVNKNYDKHGGTALITFNLTTDKEEIEPSLSYNVYYGYEYDGSIQESTNKNGGRKIVFDFEKYREVVNKASSTKETATDMSDDNLPF
jgi:hypothetical protein